MGQLLGILGAQDTTLVSTITPEIVTGAVNDLLAKYVEERDRAFAYFVQDETTAFKTLYPIGGGGEMQELGPDGRPLEDRVTGNIETAYPIRRFGTAFGFNAETFAYLDGAELERQVNAQTIANARTHRRQILKAVYSNINETWKDEVPGIMAGDLTIRRLANGDATLYPPQVEGDDTDSTDDHYLVAGYLPAAISPTNNPLVLAADNLKHHGNTGPIVAHINSAQRAQIRTGLTEFVDGPVGGVSQGSNTATAAAIEGIPGEFLGIDGDSGVYVYVWDATPAGYIEAKATAQSAPLRRRVHAPAALRGFKLEADEEHDPLFKRTYRDRFGYGAGNRLGMVIVQLTAPGAYVIPAAYA